MTDVPRPRAPSGFANMLQKFAWNVLFKWLRPRPKGLHVRRLDAHLARDIGLSRAELERHQLELPSQTTHHPRG